MGKELENSSGLSGFDRGGIVRESEAFLQWDDPGSPLTVRCHVNTLQLLQSDIARAGKDCTAGILLGKRDESWTVEYYDPLAPAQQEPSSSPFGTPSQLQTLVDRWNSKSNRRMEVLGVYRTALFGEAEPGDDDFSALRAIAPEKESLCLLIESLPETVANVALFLVKDGAVLSRWDPKPASGWRTPAAGYAWDYEFQSYTEQEKQNAAPSRSLKWIWIMTCFVIATVLLFGFFQARRSSVDIVASVPPSDSPLGLSLQRADKDWRLTWSSSAPAIRHAISGKLFIADGAIRKTLDLDSGDLHAGAVIYSPHSDDVLFRMQVNTSDSQTPATESVRILGEPGGDSSGAFSDSLLITHRPVERVDNETAAVTHSTLPAKEEKQAVSVIGSSVASKPIPIGNRNGNAQSMPAPAISAANINPQVEQLLPSPSPVPAPAQPKPIPTGGHIQPPKLLMRRDPIYPADASGMGGTVELHFFITSQGTVRDLTVVKGSPVLRQAAIDAVRKWRYAPARLDGAPIETEGNAVVNFKGNGSG
jgi:TonB family protein